MKMLLGAFCLFGALALTKVPAPQVMAESAPESAAPVPQAGMEGSETTAICPRRWTCDGERYYTTLSACTTNCGSSCFLDYNCNGFCVCP